jgi:multidrug efflux pump subunit AcrA (membrane-fusion protein)
MDVSPKVLLFLALCAAGAATASLPAGAAGPPLPLPFVPDTAQQRAQTQLMIQQAQAQARLAASQARVQAQLDANQGRLEAQLKAEQAGTQAQLEGAGQQAATAAALADLSLPVAAATQAPLQSPPGTMELAALTPQLGRYFGADRGVLVVRAPAHGVLKLRDGDVILTIGGRVPATSSQAMRILTSYDAGEKIRLVVLREHRRIDISGTLPALPPAGP